MGTRRRPGCSGPNNHRWRGGRYTTADGYVMVHVGTGHPMADVRGYVYEHRLAMSKHLGRSLTAGELVHHKDENRQNNAIANLELTTRAGHKVLHRGRDAGLRMPEEGNPDIPCRCGCGATFPKFDDYGRPRRVVAGHNRTGQHPKRDAVLTAIQSGLSHQVDIAIHLGRHVSSVRSDLAALLENGLIEKSGRGTWTLQKEAT